MDVQFAFLCDFAEDDASGKLHALGIGIDQITANAVPAVHPLLTIVASLGYTGAEAGTKPIAVRVVDADGAHITPPIDAEIALGEPSGGTRGRARLVFNLSGLQFAAYGDYEVQVALAGVSVATLPIRVIPPAAPPVL